jgi:hypothetical protein
MCDCGMVGKICGGIKAQTVSGGGDSLLDLIHFCADSRNGAAFIAEYGRMFVDGEFKMLSFGLQLQQREKLRRRTIIGKLDYTKISISNSKTSRLNYRPIEN